MASWVQTPLQLTEQSSDEEKLSPRTPDSPVKRDSNPSFVTPLVTSTPSISLISSSDSSPGQPTKAPPSPVIIADGAAAIGRGLFYEITPELPQKKPLLQPQVESAKNMSGVMNRSKQAGHSFPPHLLPTISTQGGAKLANLKDRLREAPPYEQVTVGGGGASTLWKAFTGKGKEQKNRGETLPAEWLKKKTSNQSRDTVPGEESDLDSSTLLHRCSLKPPKNLQLELLDLMAGIQKVTMKEEEEKQELRYVPHALAFRRSYATQKQTQKNSVQDSDGQSSCPTEVVGVLVQPKELSSLSVKETMFQRKNSDEGEDLETKTTRRVQRAARRRAKQEQLKRLHKAQMIQRQLQQVEVRQRVLEEKGIMVEKALRGEAGLGKENPALMQEWFQLVQQKSALARYESEVMIFARELELEDRQSRLQLELRQRMAVDDHLKEEEWLLEERLILEEMLEVVTQRDALVSLLEEQRLQEHREDQDLEQVLIAGGLRLV